MRMQINKTFNDKTLGYAYNGFLKGWGKYISKYHDVYYLFTKPIGLELGWYGLKGLESIYLVSKSLINNIIEVNNLIYNDEINNLNNDHYLYEHKDVSYFVQFTYFLDYYNQYLNENGFDTFCIRCNVDYSNFKLYENKNKLNIQYNKPIHLSKEFSIDEFNNFTNNDELYLFIPMIFYGCNEYHICKYLYQYYNPKTNKKVTLAAFIALKITDINGDGDIKFDHIDKINYIDSLNITFTFPNKLIGVYNEN